MLLTQNTDRVSQDFDGLLRFLAKFGDISLQVGDIWLGCQIVLQQCAKRLHLDDRLLFTEANFLQLSGGTPADHSQLVGALASYQTE